MLNADNATQPEVPVLGFARKIGILFLKDWRFSAYALLVVSLLLIVFSSLSHGDELTGQAQDDPKDLMPTPSPSKSSQASDSGLFVPMPNWARNIMMPPLPVELKPMGGKTKVAGPTPPKPEPLAPPKDEPLVTTPGKPTDNNAAMIAVSPFLQWIKTNPQAAATQARQQAETYQAGTGPAAPTPANGTAAKGAPHNPAPADSQDPYWLPPMIDSPGFGAAPVTGSAAIYSTPQR